MNNILLIEDEEEIRSLIAYNVEREGFSVFQSEDANEALITIEDTQIELILLDLMLPGLSGMQFLKIIKGNSEYERIPVIIISAKNSEKDIVAALEAGADDYLTKPFSMKILIARIRAMLRRGGITEETVLSYGNIRVERESHRVFSGDEEVHLTKKEFELLGLLIGNQGRVFTRDQLLNSVWGYEAEVYTRTVDAHISSLRKKLGDGGNAIKSIPKIGYRMGL